MSSPWSSFSFLRVHDEMLSTILCKLRINFPSVSPGSTSKRTIGWASRLRFTATPSPLFNSVARRAELKLTSRALTPCPPAHRRDCVLSLRRHSRAPIRPGSRNSPRLKTHPKMGRVISKSPPILVRGQTGRVLLLCNTAMEKNLSNVISDIIFDFFATTPLCLFCQQAKGIFFACVDW